MQKIKRSWKDFESCIMFKILFITSNMKVTMLKKAVSKFFNTLSLSLCLCNHLRVVYAFIRLCCVASLIMHVSFGTERYRGVGSEGATASSAKYQAISQDNC